MPVTIATTTYKNGRLLSRCESYIFRAAFHTDLRNDDVMEANPVPHDTFPFG